MPRPQAAIRWVLLLLVPLLPAVAGAQGSGDPVNGRTLFTSKRCVSCHAVRGEGGRIGPDLGRRAVKGSFYEIAAALWNHSAAMQEKMREFSVPRPTFEGRELADLIAFLYFLNYFDEPGDAATGKVLFIEKHCVQCHRVEAVGGTAGPRLDTLPRGTSPLQIAQDLWNHGPKMVAAMRARGLDVPTFEGTEILDLFAYLRSHGGRRGAPAFQAAGDPEVGRRLFAAKDCSRCHAVFGQGNGIGPDLGNTALRGSVTQLAGRMWNHWPAMASAMETLEMQPPTFRGSDLADLFAYLFFARYDGQPGSPARGRNLYTTSHCASCHGVSGAGGVGPALREFTGREPKEALLQRMWNHAPGMSWQMGIHKIPWPRLEPQQLADLMAYLATGLDERGDSR